MRRNIRQKCLLAAAILAMGIGLAACGAGGQAPDGQETENAGGQAEDQSSDQEGQDPVQEGKAEGRDPDQEAQGSGREESQGADQEAEDGKDPSAAEGQEEADGSQDASSQEETGSDADGAVTMYTTESITLRREAAGSAENLGVVPVGSTLQAFEVSGSYIRVLYDGKEGFVLKDYVTGDKDAADQAVEAAKQAAAQERKSDGSGKKSDKDKSDKKKKDKECLDNGLLN